MEERQGHTQYRLKCLLHPPYPGAWRVGKLLEEVILSKGEDGDERGPGGGTDTHVANGDLKIRAHGLTFLSGRATPVDTPLSPPPPPTHSSPVFQ